MAISNLMGGIISGLTVGEQSDGVGGVWFVLVGPVDISVEDVVEVVVEPLVGPAIGVVVRAVVGVSELEEDELEEDELDEDELDEDELDDGEVVADSKVDGGEAVVVDPKVVPVPVPREIPPGSSVLDFELVLEVDLALEVEAGLSEGYTFQSVLHGGVLQSNLRGQLLERLPLDSM